MGDNKQSPTFDEILNQLGKKADTLYKFVMLYKDYLGEPKDYGTGEVVTMVEAHMVTTIEENPGITVSNLAEYWGRSKGATSQMVTKLEKKGFVYRGKQPDNAKNVLLYPTERGVALSMAHKHYDALDISQTLQRLLQRCTMAEIDTFYRVIGIYTDLLVEDE